MPELAVQFGGAIKFMWDGEEYAVAAEAAARAKEYRKEGFEVKELQEAGKTFLYTRREVSEVALEGAPPA